MDIQKKIEHLRTEIEQHNYNYYVLDMPTISDFEFEQLKIRFQTVEKVSQLDPRTCALY